MKDYMNVCVIVNGRELLNFHMDRENTQVDIDPSHVKQVVEGLRFVADEIEHDMDSKA